MSKWTWQLFVLSKRNRLHCLHDLQGWPRFGLGTRTEVVRKISGVLPKLTLRKSRAKHSGTIELRDSLVMVELRGKGDKSPYGVRRPGEAREAVWDRRIVRVEVRIAVGAGAKPATKTAARTRRKVEAPPDLERFLPVLRRLALALDAEVYALYDGLPVE